MLPLILVPYLSGATEKCYNVGCVSLLRIANVGVCYSW